MILCDYGSFINELLALCNRMLIIMPRLQVIHEAREQGSTEVDLVDRNIYRFEEIPGNLFTIDN